MQFVSIKKKKESPFTNAFYLRTTTKKHISKYSCVYDVFYKFQHLPKCTFKIPQHLRKNCQSALQKYRTNKSCSVIYTCLIDSISSNEK